MDFQSLLFDPIYAAMGVPARFYFDGGELTLVVLDKTSGIDVGTDVNVQTLAPAIIARVQDFKENDFSPDDVIAGNVTLNGFTWTILSRKYKPTLKGQNDGEVLFFLEDPEEASEVEEVEQ
jgi:hypothetical protein